ncbi:hypothetical protein ACFX2G_043769 [Malus domestica]
MAVTKFLSLSTLIFFFVFSSKAASSPPTLKTTKLQNQDQEKEPFVGVNIGTDVLNLLSPSDLVLFLQLQQINHVRLYDVDLDILKALSKTKIWRLSTPGNSWRGSKKDETYSSNSNQHQVNHNLPEQALFADRGQRQVLSLCNQIKLSVVRFTGVETEKVEKLKERLEKDGVTQRAGSGEMASILRPWTAVLGENGS